MPLKELVLFGFKSFADKTEIHFDSGITGIIGPNGSGKSNITEAIRWAMGEASAKSLRGEKMKDVIFAGSEFRPAMNHAEVSLIFDNRQRNLNFKADQVTVTRKLLRSGDSEYQLNGKDVRLKDIHALFLDSGISQNSLAIISQGRVDQILNSKPEDRRGIFEEAAGVLHFKEQKELAQRQLSKTADNLIRINDLVKELENRLDPLAEQASLAKQYRFQKQGLDQKLKMLLAFEIEDLSKQQAQAKGQAEKGEQLLNRLDSEVKTSRDQLAQKRESFKSLSDKRTTFQQEAANLSEQLAALKTSLEVSQQSAQFDNATRQEYQKQKQSLQTALKADQAAAAELTKQLSALAKNKEALLAQEKELTEQLQEDPDKLRQKQEQQRNHYIDLLQTQTRTKNELLNFKQNLKREQSNQDHQSSLEPDLKAAQDQLVQFKKRGMALKGDRKQLLSKQQQANTEFSQLKAALAKAEQKQNQAGQQLQAITARRDALTQIQKRHDGYYYGVKNVLNHAQDFTGIVGVIGELLSFPAKLEAALSTALGGSVQDIVTETRADARDAIQQLKKRHGGRATFLPLDGLRTHTIPRSTMISLQAFAGFKGRASELVTSTAKVDISQAIDYLLANVLVVDNLDTAMAINRRIGHYRIVTLAGDIISPGGSMTGGARNRHNNSPLQVAAEISTLTAQIQQQTAAWQKASVQAKQLEQQLADKQERLRQSQTKLNNLNTDLKTAAISYQNQERECQRLKAALKLEQNQAQAQSEQIRALQAKIAQSEQTLKQVEADCQNSKQLLATLGQKITNFTAANQKVQASLNDLRPQLAVLTTKEQNLRKRQDEKQASQASQEQQLKQLEQQLQQLAKNNQHKQADQAEYNQRQSDLLQKKTELQEQLTTLNQQLGQLNGQIDQLEAVANRNYDLRKDAASQQEEFSVQLAQFDNQISQRLKQLSKNYSLTYEAALKQATMENNEENRQQLAKSVKLHRMSLADIGPVNLQAIADYQQVKSRYDFLNGQQNDLLQARDNLQKSMTDLDSEVKTRFAATFNKIAAKFKELFPQVFGGGQAKLVLTDPDQLLATGIEIIARPPGKKLQRLGLLSGGERALTAITLLFAMIEVNPVPFCVLDEVEAALDDVNVARFARFLRKFDLKTQFIVITHRRGTMEKADQLYGVVMQESGVSQVLSVSLKDLKDEVN